MEPEQSQDVNWAKLLEIPESPMREALILSEDPGTLERLRRAFPEALTPSETPSISISLLEEVSRLCLLRRGVQSIHACITSRSDWTAGCDALGIEILHRPPWTSEQIDEIRRGWKLGDSIAFEGRDCVVVAGGRQFPFDTVLADASRVHFGPSA